MKKTFVKMKRIGFGIVGIDKFLTKNIIPLLKYLLYRLRQESSKSFHLLSTSNLCL